ncbi:sugar phosphate isomerase/epimerase [bacterium]|nr:sugar phosphate isomerase/epimerase [bacterium]
MKLCGHTMGMPDKSIFEALEFCASLGLEGIEIRCAANGHLDPETVDPFRVALIAEAAHRSGVAIACLTPYYKDYSTPEAAEATLAGIHKTCQIAEDLDCRLVRATGGVWTEAMGGLEARTTRERIWDGTVAGLQQAADLAIQHHVRLALENHSGTLTQTAEDTVAMVRQVDRPNLGILMDHYWVVAAACCQQDAGAPTALLDAVRLQAPYVLHCHVKNIVWVDGKPQANFLDEGAIDWLPILRILQEHGYDGYLSDEYEKFWRPELPEPEEGMGRNARYLRETLGRL